ncbi:MAG TPA: PQQ-binding-like beta-propeller repeat protein [Candidatus Dormibacteraeota bacterium]|nr:PQQ-binding-like beta-propeller repeat protein [Candidatus Dormibacteraeota bacterium]
MALLLGTKPTQMFIRIAACLLMVCAGLFGTDRPGATAAKSTTGHADHDWPIYGGTAENNHYSPLTQIERKNVKQLQVAWTFDTGEPGGLQTSPIEVDGVLYGLTPSQKVFALNAATGNLLWQFDSGIKGTQPDRGLASWSDGKERRIIVGVMNFVYALDAATGKPIPSFGKDGRIDLREDLGRDPAAQSIYMTSPVVIYKDLMIVGGRESETLPASPGDVRAYDVRNGKLRWSFHTIPHPGEFGYDTWPKEAWKTSGAANNWTGMTVDTTRGIVYVPTGSAAFDFDGADRIGDDLFANCLIALSAQTGERIWHFQGVRHDLWDRDFPAPPVLLTVERDGKKVDAVAQTSKQGFVFLFDRTNGNPLFPIECKNYPPSDVPGETAAQQQCLPAKPAPFARQVLTTDLLGSRTPEIHQWALEKFRTFRSDGQFVPFGVGKDTVVFPGFDGGAEWGGAAADPETGILYVNANDLPWTGALAENKQDGGPKALYLTQCAVCHGENMAGSPPGIPSLVGLGDRMPPPAAVATVRNGKGRMPGFSNIDDDQIYALLDYIMSGGKDRQNEERKNKDVASAGPAPTAIKYHFTGYHRFYDPDGYPAVAPPWGTLSAINLNTGEYAWKIPLGEYPELAAQGLNNTGTENYGGPLVTAGGLLFIGATNFDNKFRAFDKSTGELLWETTLPFAGNATPATYEVNGRQFVVIAAGGGKNLKVKSGGVYVAFALK